MAPQNDPLWNWDAISAIATSLATIATFLAVIVALFGKALREKLFKPNLKLTITNPLGEVVTVGITPPNEGDRSGEEPKKERHEDARYYHLKVSNKAIGRWPSATNVHVYLLRIDELGPDGEFHPAWNGEIPLLWQHHGVMPHFRTIGPSVNCALCSVVKGKWVGLHPLVMYQPFKDRYRDTAHIRLLLQARSNEADSDLCLIQIDWDGKWVEGKSEMGQHMIVKKVIDN